MSSLTPRPSIHRFNIHEVAPFLSYHLPLVEEPLASLKEDFLQYIWRLQRYYRAELETTSGEKINILQAGIQNHNDGPDFLNGKISIGSTTFVGNIEIHLRSSEWKKHQHQYDPAYNSVILHVVLVEDEIIYHQDGSRIPCIELRSRIPSGLPKIYLKLLHNETWIPCQNLFYKVKSIHKNLWLDRMLSERIEQKTKKIVTALENNTYDWENVFFQKLCRSFGTSVNAEPFEQLGQLVPLQLIRKHQDQLFQLEALLFGQAGMLEKEFEEEYPNKLKKEFNFLRKKYQLKPMSPLVWKKMRLRPANFPTIRIAQLAWFLFKSRHVFSKILAAQSVKEIENMFQLKVSTYWNTHYTFEKSTDKRIKKIGKSTIHLLVINTIVPTLFLYGEKRGATAYKEKALQFLEQIPAEKNNVIAQWKKLGMEVKTASQSQALLQLKKEYCAKQSCLNCRIGHQIMIRN